MDDLYLYGLMKDSKGRYYAPKGFIQSEEGLSYSRCLDCNVAADGRPAHASITCKAGHERVVEFAEQEYGLQLFLMRPGVDMRNQYANQWRLEINTIRAKINGEIETRGLDIYLDGQHVLESSDHVILHHSSETLVKDNNATESGHESVEKSTKYYEPISVLKTDSGTLYASDGNKVEVIAVQAQPLVESLPVVIISDEAFQCFDDSVAVADDDDVSVTSKTSADGY